MEDVLLKELKRGLEDIVGKFNNELGTGQKLMKMKYSLCVDKEDATISRTVFTKKGHCVIIIGIDFYGNVIEATPRSSDQRLTEVKNYLQTFCEKYEGKGVVLKYQDLIRKQK